MLSPSFLFLFHLHFNLIFSLSFLLQNNESNSQFDLATKPYFVFLCLIQFDLLFYQPVPNVHGSNRTEEIEKKIPKRIDVEIYSKLNKDFKDIEI